MAKNNIYQIKVTLKHSKPPIWRRIELARDTRLDQLHLILQDVMGWENYHLHQFVVGGGIFYGEPSPDDWAEILDENEFRLDQLVSEAGDKFVYEYDFGDNWEHDVLLEKILPAEANITYPRCIKGKRACPPEDVGGIWGYDDYVAAITDPTHPRHEDMIEWRGDDFDPAAFDLAEINEALRRFK